ATNPVPTGSLSTAKTIGMTDVARFAAGAATPPVTMISTLSRTNSSAISGKRSLRPSAHRYSIATLRPSIQPRSRSRCTKTTIHWLHALAVVGPRKPKVSGFVRCCARAVSGHAAAALLTSVMNSRRFIFALTHHLVGAAEKREWDGQTKGLGRSQVEDKLDFDRLLNGQVSRLLALKNPA